MLCPICNGFQQLNVRCASCGKMADDCGRPSDWTGPYAPYEPIAEYDPVSASADGICRHIAYCSHCRDWFEVSVASSQM
ncbi:hypothetical protein IJ21_13670 [Paenibacillus sp. 32O-W]|jgi:hypothetical protein|nr:hypothetical protein IJ21_13670 [Paenibacillus sp. 32O-W]